MLWLLWTACSSPPPSPSVVVAADPEPVVDPGDAAVRLRVQFGDAAVHRVAVEASTSCPDAGVLGWWMAVWTPGSYLVREYARHVEQIEGTGEAVTLTKVTKNRWETTCTAGSPVGIRYTLYARRLSVTESFVDEDWGVLNGAATFILPDTPPGPIDLHLALPEAWSGVTSLPPHPSQDPGRYLVPDVDTLFDAPILLGSPDIRSFEIQGVPHHAVTLGTPGPFDPAQAAEDVERIAQATTELWGSIPYPEYRFLTVLAERRGGLEHHDSTLMMTSRWSTSTREDYLRLLGLVSHEFFHAWNVKRLRPVGLGPFQYERETYTPSLWVAEGITSYYDDVLLARAGLLTEEEYLVRMSENLSRLQEQPGRLVESLSEASFDSWIKYYRRDEDSRNRTVSYYTKGAVVAWLLDAEVRRASRDRASLDDVMRAMWAQHREVPYTPEDFRRVAGEVAGVDLGGFFTRNVDQAGELDYGGALQWWGLRFAEGSKDQSTRGWLGAKTREAGGRLVISEVIRNTPAWDAGLSVDDEILAVDDERIPPGPLSKRLEQLGVDHEGSWLVARRGRLIRVPVRLGAVPARRALEPDPGASPLAARRRAAWLTPD